MKLAVGLVLVLIVSIAVIALLIAKQPTPRYFAATPDLRLAPLIPLDKPVLTQQGLLNWVTETISNAVSLDFLEWREKLSKTRENFEETAYKSFLASLKSSGILDMIQEKRLSVSAVVTRAPVITASGLVGGTATWKVEFPLIVSYESSQGVESTQRLMTTMARESRKWNLSIGLYTQSIDDIPDIITELATTIVILGAGTDKSIADMGERFGLNGACRHALGHLGKPGPAGSNLVALFRTGAGKSQLVLSLTIGGQALWAFSTTTEDVAIRNHLYKRMLWARPFPLSARPCPIWINT